MFDHHCPVCAARVLVFPSQVTGLTSTPSGVEVTFTCWCDTEQSQLMNQPAERRPRHAVAA